jgi:anthranilate phosphoribosyltransferase
MIEQAIHKLVDKQDLTYDEAHQVITEIMQGETTAVQTAAFLAALSTKSTKAETIDEIAGCAAAMRALATPVTYNKPVLEIVGTGGDKAGSFNISTTAAFIIAAGGVKVAKHGNRAASSKSGTADVQEALGANIHQNPQVAPQMLDEVGMTFFFAQDYHAAMKYVGPIRKELGIRTVFNILGPLTNPAKPEAMVLGVYDGSLVESLAKVLQSLGVKRGMVVFGEAVLDEISTACNTKVCELNGEDLKTYTITPEQFGFERSTKQDLEGGSAEENAAITRGILDGSITGAKRNTVLMNAGAGLYIGGAAASLEEGVARAQELLDSGAALATMEAYIQTSNKLAQEA